jgi:NADH-quinone oxidoreductase subunit C
VSGADELAATFAAHLGDEVPVEDAFGQLTVDVPAARWVDALTFARDELGYGYFDWLTGVDELADGFSVVAHLWSLPAHQHLLVRTRVPREAPSLASAVGVFPGANWHERETFEMFGVEFAGHPNLIPLLLPDGFEGHPLRKDFMLAARAAKSWPGAKEPGESDHDLGRAAPGRRRMLPPGVPDAQTWGPRPPATPSTEPGGSEPGGAEPGGAEPGGAETGSAESGAPDAGGGGRS